MINFETLILKLRGLIFLALPLLPAFIVPDSFSADSNDPPTEVVGFNCADSFYTGADGINYYTDREYSPELGAGYIGGYEFLWNRLSYVGGDMDFKLFKSTRKGVEEYRFDVPDGTYIIKLGFVETEYDWRGQRVQDIYVEGVKMLDNLDIWELAERNYGIEISLFATVTDGQLNVVFVPVKGETMIANLAVYQWSIDSEPPPRVSGFATVGSYGLNILRWDEQFTPDIAGYIVYRKDEMDMPFYPVTAEPTPFRRYLDRNVKAGNVYRYRVSAVDLFGNEGEPSPAAEGIPVEFGSSLLPWCRYRIDEEQLARLNKNIFSDEYADITFDSEDCSELDAGIRYRGYTSKFCPKKSIKIRFETYIPAYGGDRLNFNSERGDVSLIRERLAFDLFEESGILAPRTGFRALWRNDEFRGVFTEVEQLGPYFLENHGLSPGDHLFKCSGLLTRLQSGYEYIRRYENETGHTGAVHEIIKLTEFLGTSNPDHVFADLVRDKFDVEETLTWYATQIMLGNSDFIGHNYYLYFRDGSFWRFIPWDLDMTFGRPKDTTVLPVTFGTSESPQSGRYNMLWERLLGCPRYRRLYGGILRNLIQTVYNRSSLAFNVYEAHDLVLEDGRRDYFKHYFEENRYFEESPETILDFVDERIAFVSGAFEGLVPPPSVNLYLNEFMGNNQTTITDEAGDYDPWLELFNCSDETVPLNGLVLETGGESWSFPDGSYIAPGGYRLIWLDGETWEGDLHAVLTPDSEQGSFILRHPGNPFENPSDSLWFGPAEADLAYGRYRDAGYFSALMENPTPRAENEWTAPVRVSLEIEPDSVYPKEPLEATITVTNTSTRSQSGILSYNLRFPDGIRWPFDNQWCSTPFTVEPGGFTSFSQQFKVSQLAPDGDYAFEVKIRDTGGGIYCENESFFELMFRRPTGFCINEFLAGNSGCFCDEEGEYDDWIELYNGEKQTVSIGGLYITDDINRPDKFKLPDIPVPPGGFVIVWADDDTSQGSLHCPFKLDMNGEEIALFGWSNGRFRKYDHIKFGPGETDVSCGRFLDGAEQWAEFTVPTPGESNGISIDETRDAW